MEKVLHLLSDKLNNKSYKTMVIVQLITMFVLLSSIFQKQMHTALSLFNRLPLLASSYSNHHAPFPTGTSTTSFTTVYSSTYLPRCPPW